MNVERLTREELVNLETLNYNEILASMNFVGLPVICVTLDFKIAALNDLAAQVFATDKTSLNNTDFRKLCSAYQLDFPIFSQAEVILDGAIIDDFIQWLAVGTANNGNELRWAIIRHMAQDALPDGFVLIVTKGFQEVIRRLNHEYCATKNNIKVFLIEDDPVCQSIAKNIFEDLYCEVTIAASANQALELLGDDYDIIFMDIGLPDKDGMTLTRELRKKLKIAVPIIATTGYSWDINSYDEVGINDYIKKPLTYAKLRRILTKFL